MSDEVRFDEADYETFKAAFEGAARALRERPPLTQTERDAGWSEDPNSGLHRNEVTDEWDDFTPMTRTLLFDEITPVLPLVIPN